MISNDHYKLEETKHKTTEKEGKNQKERRRIMRTRSSRILRRIRTRGRGRKLQRVAARGT